MAAVPLSVFDRSSRRLFALAQARLAAALAFSVLAHIWLAARMVVDAPVRAMPHGPATFTARLEAPAVAQLPLPPETADAKKIARRDARDGGGPVPSGTPHASTISPAPGPWSSAEMQAPHALMPELPQIPDPVYYPARQLDVYPALLQSIRLEYPRHAAQSQVSGKVLVMLLIDEAGLVNEISIAEAEPAGYFETAVHAAFTDARFSPARKDGRAVKSRVLISVSYNPGATEGARSLPDTGPASF